MMDDLEMPDVEDSSMMKRPLQQSKVDRLDQYQQPAPDMVQSFEAYQQQDAWKRFKSMPRTVGKQMQNVDVEQGEMFQQFLPGNVIMSSSNELRQGDGVDESNKDIVMGELMVALDLKQAGEHEYEHKQEHDHVNAGQVRQAGGERRYAVPRSHHRPGRLVQADDLLENNNAKTHRNRPSPRQLLDSYRPDKDQDSTMADQDRGPREDRGYNGGSGRGGFNRKRRYRGK